MSDDIQLAALHLVAAVTPRPTHPKTANIAPGSLHP